MKMNSTNDQNHSTIVPLNLNTRPDDIRDRKIGGKYYKSIYLFIKYK